MEEYQNLAKDLNQNQAATLVQMLEDHQIPHQVDPLLQPIAVGDVAAVSFEKEYSVSVKQEHYLAAIEAMGQMESLAVIAEEHPFDAFSDEELLAVYHFPEEWSNPDYEYAKKLIEARNIKDDIKVKERILEEKVQEMQKPAEASIGLLFGGYLFSLAGGLIGLLIALQLVNKEKVIDGVRGKFFDDKSRNHGQNMLVICMLWVLIYMVAFFA